MSNLRYGGVSIAFHWIIALMIAISFGVGWYMADLPLSPDKLKIYSWHKWAGVTIFALVVLRTLWRATHPAPAMPASMSGAQQKFAMAGHLLLYVLMFAVPLTGWLMSSAKGYQTVWFGVLPIPDLLGKDKELGELLETAHRLLNYLLALVVLGHIGAALKHHFKDRDDVLRRMLPAKR
jgi:cytochrome b561